MSQILRNMKVAAFVESMQENVDKALKDKQDEVFNIVTDAHALKELLRVYMLAHKEKPEWIAS